jgi:MerR family transcriptional regulator, heat shock protein HspR
VPSEQHYLEPHEQGRPWSWSSRGRDEPEVGAARPEAPFRVADDADTPVYVISVAADLADLHPQTLRAYEREGLLTPARTEGGTRRYSRRDVERLRFIRTLTQDEGLNLAGVRVVLDLGEKLEASRRRVAELEEMVRVLADRLEPQEPSSDRYAIVKSPPSQVEVHPLRRRTGERGHPIQRARPVRPPERSSAEL